MMGYWRKLHNDGLHALYPSLDSIRAMELMRICWAVHVARMGEKINAYRVPVGKPDEKRSRRTRRRGWMWVLV